MPEEPLVSLEITSFAVDDARHELMFGFTYSDGVGVELEKAISRTGEDMDASLATINALFDATAQAQADAGQAINLNVYELIETALRAAVAQELGVTLT